MVFAGLFSALVKQEEVADVMELLVVGGGGQGSANYGGGGGGGGMLTTSFTFTKAGYSVNVEVGAGGNGWTSGSPVPPGPDGSDSSYGSYVAIGGGGGGGQSPTTTATIAQTGGSGGGGSATNTSTNDVTLSYGGSGTSGQGNDGGNGTYLANTSLSLYSSAGGGGAGGAGGDAPNGYGGHGGDAKQWYVDLQYYAAGGGGGTRASGTGEPNPGNQIGGSGGFGGGVELGGHGQPLTAGGAVFTGTGGAPNTGSGGGGGFATDANGVQEGGADGVVKAWVPFSYTFAASHLSNVTNNLTCTSSALTYNNTAGTLITFTGAGTATWTPSFSSASAAGNSNQTDYYIEITTNIFNQNVIANVLYPLTSGRIVTNQPDLDLTTNNIYVFEVTHNSNLNKVLQFNTTADSYDATFESTYVTRTGTPGSSSNATVTLDLSSYTGTEVFYFDSATTGMGYVEAPTTGVTTKVVTVATDSNGANAYYIDTVERDQITFAASTSYVFDQSDSSNAGHQIVFGTTVDDTNNIYQPSDGVTIMGEPGEPGAYTKLVLPSTFTGTLYYYCYSHTGMGYSSSYLATNYDVTSVLNAWATNTSNNVFSYTLTGETTYTFANGTYNINVSDYHSSNGLKLNQVLADGGGSYNGYDWHGDPNTGAYDSNGNPPSTYSSTVDSVTYNGSWIQLSLPYKLEITEVHITGRYLAANTATVDRYPKDALMAGSNDNGATFEFIDDFTTTYTSNSNNRQTVNVTSSKGYYLIRMHVKTTYGAGPMNMEHWSLTGNVVN